MARYDFWVHGANTIVEFPHRVTRLQHAGWGTYIEQASDPEGRRNNWFHLPIPTPTYLDGTSNVSLWYIRLRAQVNENARIAELHIRDGQTLIQTAAVAWTVRTSSRAVSFYAQESSS